MQLYCILTWIAHLSSPQKGGFVLVEQLRSAVQRRAIQPRFHVSHLNQDIQFIFSSIVLITYFDEDGVYLQEVFRYRKCSLQHQTAMRKLLPHLKCNADTRRLSLIISAIYEVVVRTVLANRSATFHTVKGLVQTAPVSGEHTCTGTRIFKHQ